MNIDKLLLDIDGGLVAFRPTRPNRSSITASLLQRTATEQPAVVMGDADFVIVTPTQRADFRMLDKPLAWHFPVGSDKYPVEQWYIASRHLEHGTIWAGGVHTGIDYNVEVSPRGDIDRGQPVFAIADGSIYATGYSQTSLASIVIEIQHEGKLLWVRYWHLADDDLFKSWRPGLPVEAGRELGHLGNYLRGGDHLHFDMCREAFHPCVWWTRTSGATNAEKLASWVDPVPVLKVHLDPDVVDKSLRIG